MVLKLDWSSIDNYILVIAAFLAAEQQLDVLRRNPTGDFKQKILEYAIWL